MSQRETERERKATSGTTIVKGRERETLGDLGGEREREGGQEAAISPSPPWCCRCLWVCLSVSRDRDRGTRAHADDFAVCVSTDGKPRDIAVLCGSGRGGGSLRSETQSAW